MNEILPLPMWEYPLGHLNRDSSKMHVKRSPSLIQFTFGTFVSNANIFPNVIRAFNTWNNGISTIYATN